jgi:hypothetical protein
VVFDKRVWRRDCTAGGIAHAMRQMVELTPTPPRVALLRDEKWRSEALIASLRKQINELKANLTGLEAAQRTKTKTTTAEEDKKAEVQ